MTRLGRDRRFDIFSGGCYVRLSSLELVADEIYRNNVEGSVAELGVFRGRFAEKINLAFPNRTFYLFDTFEGFHSKDVEIDQQKGYSTADVNLSETSVEFVLQRMPHQDKCVVRKGWFPETTTGIEDVFAFVSIDADLCQPILEGLKYFYPRLSPGGYIFVHDYNNAEFKGARQAVQQYCFENGVSYFPLSDYAGSTIIGKGLSSQTEPV